MATANDQWDEMFETFVTITVGTDMMGHVRVKGTNNMLDDKDPVVVELLIEDDDPITVDKGISVVVADVYMRASLD